MRNAHAIGTPDDALDFNTPDAVTPKGLVCVARDYDDPERSEFVPLDWLQAPRIVTRSGGRKTDLPRPAIGALLDPGLLPPGTRLPYHATFLKPGEMPLPILVLVQLAHTPREMRLRLWGQAFASTLLHLRSSRSAERTKARPTRRQTRRARRKSRKRGLPSAAVLAVLRADPCAYCGAPRGATVDHITPFSVSGDNGFDNLCGACHDCNGRKADQPLLTFLLSFIAPAPTASATV